MRNERLEQIFADHKIMANMTYCHSPKELSNDYLLRLDTVRQWRHQTDTVSVIPMTSA